MSRNAAPRRWVLGLKISRFVPIGRHEPKNDRCPRGGRGVLTMVGDVVCGAHAGGDVAILLARILAGGASGADGTSAAAAGAGFLIPFTERV